MHRIRRQSNCSREEYSKGGNEYRNNIGNNKFTSSPLSLRLVPLWMATPQCQNQTILTSSVGMSNKFQFPPNASALRK